MPNPFVKSGPLTWGQRWHWLEQQLPIEKRQPHQPTVYCRIPAGLAMPDVRDVISEVAARHESLRSTFSMSRPVQFVSDVCAVELESFELEEDSLSQNTVHRVSAHLLPHGFDIEEAPRWRAAVLTRDGTPQELGRPRPPGPAPSPTPFSREGSVLALDGEALQQNARYDALTLKIMRRSCTPTSNCLDVGASVGEILRFMVEVAPGGRHFAVEPLPHFATTLRADFPGVIVWEAAASDTAGRAEFVHVVSNPAYSGLHERPYDRGGETLVPIQVGDQPVYGRNLPRYRSYVL